MQTMIEGYRNHPGEHCGSAAMANLLYHYCGLDLPEAAVFGLGAGLDCFYLCGGGMDPSAVVFGRGPSMETQVAEALQIDYREQIETDDEEAWRLLREETLAGRPTMLSGDIFYLDYREYKVHFPAHRFVMLGFDDSREIAWIADRLRPEPEACSYRALSASRNPDSGISTLNLWGRFGDTQVGRELEGAIDWAIKRCVRQLGAQDRAAKEAGMFGADVDAAFGIAGIERLAEDLPAWGAREDRSWLASYNAGVIEKFGNGGGNFRLLYADFLDWARQQAPGRVSADAAGLARQAGKEWTQLAATLHAGSENGDEVGIWQAAGDSAGRIAELESALLASLA